MTDREQADPFALFGEWLAEAEKSELNDPMGVALATADGNGVPSVRMVLLKASMSGALSSTPTSKAAKVASSRPTRQRHSAFIGNRCAGRCVWSAT